MARLMSQAKAGFYPAAEEAVAAVLARLRPPTDGECLIVDPCAGQGLALLQLAQGLNNADAYGVELCESRAAMLAALLDEDKVLAPADFLRTAISHGSFSLAFVNPPYEYATGGEGRVERQFLEKSVHLLAPGGVLALVCPESVARDYETAEFFETHCTATSALPFPESVRHYHETVVLGVKRRSAEPVGYARRSCYDWLDRQLANHVVYTLPAGKHPKTFRKTEPTDTELARLVAESPLRFMIDRPALAEAARGRPPMSIGIGHRAMLLASGHIDGLICPSDEPPHVIRGTAMKEKYVASRDVTEDERGNLTTRTVVSEKPRLVITVLDSEGNLTTLE